MEELQTMMQQTKERLQKLPVPVSKDPVMELMHLIGDFSGDLLRHAEGATAEGNQFELIGKAHETFRRRIRATAPDFRPFENNDACIPERAGTPQTMCATPPRFPSPQPTSPVHLIRHWSQVAPSVVESVVQVATPLPDVLGYTEDFPEPRFLLSEETDILPLSQDPIYIDDVVERVKKYVI
jgi:hypothetical protein